MDFLSTAMRFVMMRAEGEAAALGHDEVFPDHLLLGIFKYVELSAEEISPSSSHKSEIDLDIDTLKTAFKDALKVNPGSARSKLRRILRADQPTGEGMRLTAKLLARAAHMSNNDKLYPGIVFVAMLGGELSPAMKSVLNISSGADGAPKPANAPAAEPAEPVEPEETGLPFLSSLTERIRDMRYALLEKVHGQDHVVHTFAEGMFAAEVLAAADEQRVRPRAIFVFAGPPGVGKTFLAEQAAAALNIPFKRFDMSSYADHQAHMQLIGFAPSYKDAKPGLLTGFVQDNPHSILLFDEIEKASLNTIHLFLQILDAGRLHDDYADKDVAFKDTIIIFTSNAGRQLYEGEHKGSAAGLPRQTILNALETDTHPQTGKPFFPTAICSRLATGYPMMFNHLAAHNLEAISAGELARFGDLFAKQYGINVGFDELLPATLLFAEGGQADARTLRAQSELFFKNEMFKLCRLWGVNIATALEKLATVRFTVDKAKLPENVLTLFENPEVAEVLVFGDALFAARLQDAAPQMIVHSAMNQDEAFTLLGARDVGFVLLKLVNDTADDFDPMATRLSLDEPIPGTGMGTVAAFDNIPMAASSLATSRGFFKALHERLPEIPIYLLEDDSFIIDAELENTFVRAGARGKLKAATADIGLFAEELDHIANQLHLQSSAASLAAEHKVLAFETAPILSEDKTEAVIRLRELALRRAAEASDTSVVLDEVEKPKVGFADVIGAEGAKDELKFFIQYLKNPKSFAAKGLKPPKGVLLYGPPGTGKTLLAKAMAGESDVAFIPAVASAFVTKWQGSGPEAVRELFKRARRYAPAIVFIDEIDAVGKARGTGSGHGEEMALNALLTEMDGFTVDPKRPVFVLAATNFDVEAGQGGMGVIDGALARRFDRKILVDLPTKADRRRYLDYMLNKRGEHAVTDEMLERLSGRSTGMSLANLESVIELAARTAAKQDVPLNDEILEEALEITRHGEQKDWGHGYLERVARHEAGHAYLCFLGGNTPSYLTIVARGGHGGYMEHADTENSPLQTREFLLNRIRTSLGGRAAELVYYGDEDGLSTGASGDLEGATRIARAMLVTYGMDEEFGLMALSREEAEKGPLAGDIQRRVNVILNEQMRETVAIVRDGRAQIDRLVTALLEKNKLTGDEMEALLKE